MWKNYLALAAMIAVVEGASYAYRHLPPDPVHETISLYSLSLKGDSGIAHTLVKNSYYIASIRVNVTSGIAPNSVLVAQTSPNVFIASLSPSLSRFPDAWLEGSISSPSTTGYYLFVKALRKGPATIRLSSGIYHGDGQPLELLSTTSWTGRIIKAPFPPR